MQLGGGRGVDRMGQLADPFSKALEQYSVLRDLGLSYQRSPEREGIFLEFWPPGEPGGGGFMRPEGMASDRPGVEVYSNEVRPIDVLGDVVSHHLIENHPRIKGYYDTFVSSMTPEQRHRLREQYRYSKENFGERRPYDVWERTSGLPAYFRGYAFQQWPDAEQMYTPEQLRMFDEMMGFLRQGR